MIDSKLGFLLSFTRRKDDSRKRQHHYTWFFSSLFVLDFLFFSIDERSNSICFQWNNFRLISSKFSVKEKKNSRAKKKELFVILFLVFLLFQLTKSQLILKPSETIVFHSNFHPFIASCLSQTDLQQSLTKIFVDFSSFVFHRFDVSFVAITVKRRNFNESKWKVGQNLDELVFCFDFFDFSEWQSKKNPMD